MSLRILALKYDCPREGMNAGDRRFIALLELMARRHHVDLVLTTRARTSLPPEEHEKDHAFWRGINVQLLPYGGRDLSDACVNKYYDIGFVEYYWLAEQCAGTFRQLQPKAKLIVDSVDVHFAREAAGAKLGELDAKQAEETRAREVAAYRSTDAVVLAAESDREFLRPENGMPPQFALPIIMPTRPRVAGARPPEVLFIGAFRHSPNLDGLRWFVSEIWPNVRAAVGDANLTVIGSNPPPEVLAFEKIPGVHARGFVPDVNPYLDRAAVSVAPLRYGGGMKGKVIEAMASGLPVVTTSVGAQGIGAVSGEHLVVADAPGAFGEALIALLRDGARAERLGLAGQQHAAALCGPEVVAQSLEQMLRAVHPFRRPVIPPWKWCGRFLAYHSVRLLRRLLAGRTSAGDRR